MPTENWGEHDYYFSAAGHTLQIGYEVQVTTQSSPAEDASVSEARLYFQTPLMSSDAAPDETRQLMKNGSGLLKLDLSTYDPKLKSPLLVQFVFGKEFTTGPKKGTVETNDKNFKGVVLAVPDVAAIGVRKDDGSFARTWHAKAGETVKLEVSEWGVHLFDDPAGPVFQGGIPGDQSTKESARFPSGYDSDVKWFVDNAQQGTGSTLSYKVPATAAGHELHIEAYRFADLKLKATPFDAGRRASASVAVIKVEVVGVTDKGSETTAHAIVPPGAIKRFKAKVTPADAQRQGTLEWSTTSDKVTLGDGKQSLAKVPGDEVHVHGLAQSAADNDVTLEATFTSTLTKKTVDGEHELTVKPKFTADFYDPHKNGDKVKQYVNLKVEAGKPHGSRVKLKVGPKEDKGKAVADRKGAEGDLIFVQAVFAAGNSKRNSPAPALWIGGKAVAAESDKRTFKGQVKLEAHGEPVELEVELGVAGKDTCEVKIGATDALGDATLELEVLRKVFFQVTVPDGLAANPHATSDTIMNAVGVELEKYESKTIASTEEPVSWFDGAMIESGKTGKKLILGTHNIAKFKPKFVKKAEKTPAMHVLYCDYQFDAQTTEHDATYPITAASKIMFPPDSTTEVRGYRLAGSDVHRKGMFFEKSIHDAGEPVVKVSWKSKADGTKNGTVPRDHILINHVKYGNAVFIKLPAAAVTQVEAGDDLELRTQLHWTKGPYLGWTTSGDRHIVIKGGLSDDSVNATITHELGHAMGQVVKTAPPGLEAAAGKPLHAWFYEDARGHQGPHCANGISKAIYDDVTKDLMGKPGKCIMYGAETPEQLAAMAFCDVCAPFCKAVEVKSVTT